MSINEPVRAGRREWTGLAVLALPTILIGLDMTVLHLATAKLSESLRPSGAQLLWIVDIYGFLVASLLATMGTVGDRIGRRKLLLIGAAAFAAASLLAAYATGVAMLIVARALLGIAGATLMPSTLSLISNMFHDPNQRRFAIAVWMTNFSVGGMIGPLVGGVLLEHFWWGSVFLVGVPVGVILLIVGPVLLPEYRDPQPGRLDPLSVVLSIVTVLPVVYGFKQVAQDGVRATSLLTVALGLGFAVAFVRRQLRITSPILDLRLFSRPGFSVALGGQTMGLFVVTGTQFLVLQYFQLVLGLSPLTAGLWALPAMVAGIVGTILAPAVAARLHPGRVMAGGFAIAVPGLVLISLAGSVSGFALTTIGFAVLSLGVQAALALTNDMIISSAPPERAGNASGVGETGAELGNALGVAAFGSVATAFYGARMAGDALPDGVRPELADLAQSTLTGATEAAGRLPDGVGDELLATARSAFTSGMHAAALCGVGILVLLALASLKLARRSTADAAGTVKHFAGTEPDGTVRPDDVERCPPVERGAANGPRPAAGSPTDRR
ncbi:MFS transporter [Streptomyces sp. FxanaA7]|uniref:MFS transporter n=1 Tax=Streptomyces sp. FxanaA7 TaxID=1265492 RepID=UPI000AB403F2|nr:MFS transporter [Streptomyces sp. FxanaA7]